ncbi:MAG: glycyl-radical enzyme activating protein [Bacteroidales bacterium]|nr:glycyl-radical enzyme activating protein [Bacteroidales bacterium]
MKGLIFSVKRYAIHDGPGIRVTFFMKGCPLKCWWCHNPEGISPDVSFVDRIDRIGEKEFRRTEQVGREYTPHELLAIADRESVFFRNSGGGITFSGGEPMMQFDFLKESMKLLHGSGYHTAVDTSGVAAPERFREIFPYTSLFLYDIKHMDDIKHTEYTGVSNKMILANYRLLMQSGIDMQVRVPVIPGHNEDAGNLLAIRDFIGENAGRNLKEIDLLPFHRIGTSKYRRFALEYRMGDTKQPSQERMQEIADYFSAIGVRVKIGG